LLFTVKKTKFMSRVREKTTVEVSPFEYKYLTGRFEMSDTIIPVSTPPPTTPRNQSPQREPEGESSSETPSAPPTEQDVATRVDVTA